MRFIHICHKKLSRSPKEQNKNKIPCNHLKKALKLKSVISTNTFFNYCIENTLLPNCVKFAL